MRIDEPFKSLGSKCLVFGNGDDDVEVRERVFRMMIVSCHFMFVVGSKTKRLGV